MRHVLPLKFTVALLLVCIGCPAQQPAKPSPQERPLFNPERSTLYSQAELWKGYSFEHADLGWDAAVYRQYVRTGKFYPSRTVSRARSLHDDGIAAALRDYTLDRQKHGHLIVGVMGNALEDERCTPVYRQTVELGYQLARNGFVVSTGGGPGEMEAANLGAWLANEPPEGIEKTIDQAIEIFRKRATANPDATVCRYAGKLDYTQAAFDVLKRFPNGVESLAVPTWFYGHEPPNAFATLVAKFFSNAIREDILLSAATGGVVFAEGRAGLRQEIFQKAAQDDFASFCTVVPMVFLGSKFFRDSGVYALALQLASPPSAVGDGYRDSLRLTDDVAGAVNFLLTAHPHRVDDPEGACHNVP